MGRHRKWRAMVKKLRRKKKRQKAAQERDAVLEAARLRREASPSYQTWLSSQRALELFQEEEEARISAERHKKWLEDEAIAQKLWSDLQEKLIVIRAERAKQELLIQEEWKEEQRKMKEAKEEQKRKDEEKQRKQEELLRQIEDLITRGSELPPDLNVASETNPNQPNCPFFSKTGACRFGDRCSRNHPRPGISRVLLIPGFYDHFQLRHTTQDEFDNAEISLEYDDSETYQDFLEFYEDVVPEFDRLGRLSQFKVCCNHEPHLRGNVYIEYENAHDAVQAFKAFNGRWYAGRQLSVEFVNVNSWKAAICGQFHKQRCPKGRACNFLHVFRNPSHAFVAADRDQQVWRRRARSKSRSRSRSWSRSPSRQPRNDWRWSVSPPPKPSNSNGRSSIERTSSHRRSDRSYRNSRDRSRSRSPIRKRKQRKRARKSDSTERELRSKRSPSDDQGRRSERSQKSERERSKSKKIHSSVLRRSRSKRSPSCDRTSDQERTISDRSPSSDHERGQSGRSPPSERQRLKSKSPSSVRRRPKSKRSPSKHKGSPLGALERRKSKERSSDRSERSRRHAEPSPESSP